MIVEQRVLRASVDAVPQRGDGLRHHVLLVVDPTQRVVHFGQQRQLGLGYLSKSISIPFAWLLGGVIQLTGIPFAIRARHNDQE